MSDANLFPTEPANKSPEAIRFGSTENSGKAVFAWAKQYESNVSVGVLIRDSGTQLLVVIAHEKFELEVGDYLARVERPLDPGVFDFKSFMPSEWELFYGTSAKQELPKEVVVAPFDGDDEPDPIKSQTEETDEPVL